MLARRDFAGARLCLWVAGGVTETVIADPCINYNPTVRDV